MDLTTNQNPHLKLMPTNDLFDLEGLHHGYRSGIIHGTIVDDETHPWYERDAAKYDQAWANDQMDDDIVWEDSNLGSQYQGGGKGKRMFFHQPYARRTEQAGYGAQRTGDCVSWAIRFALELLRIQNIQHGKWEEFYKRQATCGIYSGRGHNGQGASPTRLSAYAVGIGTLFEEQYILPGGVRFDFRNYNDYVKWGMQRGKKGIPDELKEQTKSYHAREFRVITTLEGLLDAWAAGEKEGGCQIHCGSSIGVASSGDPVSKLRGSWSHDMALAGFDDTKEFYQDTVVAWDQSWGNWNKLTNVPKEWKPLTQGMFFLAGKDMPKALRARGTCAFFGFEGKPAQPHNNLF